MAETKKTPTPTTPAPPQPPGPAGGSDFDKFVRSALDHVVVGDGTKGLFETTAQPPQPSPTATTGGQTAPVPHPRNPQRGLQGVLVSGPEAEFQARHQANMVAEQERLSRLPKLPPLPSYAGTGPASFLTGASQAEIVVKEGYDPLHLRAFKFVRTLVAGGLILPGALPQSEAEGLMNDLRRALEPAPKGETPTAVPVPLGDKAVVGS
jgi:hypothetical protein